MRTSLHFPVMAPVDAPPFMSPEALQALAVRALQWTRADTMSVSIDCVTTGTARVMDHTVRLNESGNSVRVALGTAYGLRSTASIHMSQLDPVTLRDAIGYLDRIAMFQGGPAVSVRMPVIPYTYPRNTARYASTLTAYDETRHGVLIPMLEPLLDAGIPATAFAGVAITSRVYANKNERVIAGQETDAELVVSGWTTDYKASGWAGQVARDWTRLRPDEVGAEALRLTQLSANPVAYEPGRRTAILGRPAVVQLVRSMASAFSAQSTYDGRTPLYDPMARKPRFGQPVLDARLTIASDPNDPDGGYLPFDWNGYPRLAMPWIERGVLTHLAYSADFAAQLGVVPANAVPDSLRMTGDSTPGRTTIDEMIASCAEGVYVNRFSDLVPVGDDPLTGMMSGVTQGGCFLVRHGKIEKSIKNLRFIESPWYAFNRILAIGTSERAGFGYAPWFSNWPVAPTIVPPLMISDFNFSALGDAV